MPTRKKPKLKSGEAESFELAKTRFASGDDERVEAEQDGRRGRVEERAPHDDADVQHLEAHDRVRERQRDQDHRDDPVEGVLVDAEGRRQDDEEEDERDRPEDRADEDVEGLAPLARLLAA